jgi:hypothetical protein
VEEQKSVGVTVELLEEFGVLLGFPHWSAIEGSRKLRELRIQHCGEPYRVLMRSIQRETRFFSSAATR